METPNRPSVLKKNENQFKQQCIIHRSFHSYMASTVYFGMKNANIIQELFPFILRKNAFSIGFKFTITYLAKIYTKYI
jgi:hypothetical protein